MKPQITRHDIEKLVPDIRNAIAEHMRLPAKGLVAGQAVASIVYRLLNLSISGPINDIDIFMTYDQYASLEEPLLKSVSKDSLGSFKRISAEPATDSPRLPMQNRQAPTVYSLGAASLDASSSNVMNTVFKGYYLVLRAFTDGITNIVLVRAMSQPNAGLLLNQNIVNSFDINCCAIGIDMADDKLYLTDDFLEFLNSAQLRVQSAHTPIHSIIRLVKKAKHDLTGVYCDLEQELDCLKSAAVIALRYDRDSHHTDMTGKQARDKRKDMAIRLTPLLFGAKYKALFDTYAEHLPGLRCVPVEYKQSNSVIAMHTLVMDKESMRSAMKRGRLVFALRKVSVSLPAIKSILVTMYHIANATPRLAHADRVRGRARIDATLNLMHNIAMQEMASYVISNTCPRSADCPSPQAWAKAFRHLAGHGYLLSRISSLPLSAQSRAINYFVHCEKHSRWDVIGMAENDRNFGSDLTFDIRAIPKPEELHDISPSIAPSLFLPSLKTPWFSITELRSQYDFMMAGQRQRHCISGYFNCLAEYRFYEIVTPYGQSHIQLRILKPVHGPSYQTVVQHQGPRNERPHALNLRIGKYLAAVCRAYWHVRLMKNPFKRQPVVQKPAFNFDVEFGENCPF